MNFAKEHGLKYRIKGLPEEAHFVYEYRDGKVGVCDLRVNMDEVVLPSEMYGKPIEWVSLSEPYNSVTIPKTVNEIELGNTATIIGHKGSYAERYAREHYHRFVALPEEESIDGITYALYNDHAEILSVTAGDDELITLPSTIKGKPVTSFRWNIRRPEGAYWDYSNRYTLVIPDTVENIYSEEEDTRFFDRITVRCSEGTAAYDFASENDMIIDEGYHYQEDSNIQYSTDEDGNGRYAVAYVTIDGTNDIVIPNYHSVYYYSTEENPSGETLRLPVKRVELRRGSDNYGCGESYSYSYSGSRVKITFPKYVEDIRTEYSGGSYRLSDVASEVSGYAGTFAQRLAYEDHIKFNALDGYDHTTSYFQNGSYESYEGSGSVRYSSFDIVHATIPEYIKGTKITRVDLSCCNALKSITFLSSDIDVEGCYLEECLALEEIKGYRGSTAEAYAAEHDLKFTELPLPNEIPEDLVIPESVYGVPVKSIGDYAFEGCSDIKTVTIPESVTDIGIDAFCDCSSLTDLYIEGDLEKTPDYQICDEGVMIHGENGSRIWEYAVDYRVPFTGSDGAVYYPPEDLEYKYDGETMGFVEYSGTETDITIPSTIYGVPVEKICEYKTNGNDTVKKITIPSSVKTIEGSPFLSFSALEDIYFEGDLEDVPEYLICRDNVMIHGENGSKIWEYAVDYRVPFSSSDGEVYYPIEELAYQLDGETMTITYCGGKDLDTNEITIPDTIYGVPVTAIRGNASHIDKLTIPRSITEISGITSDITIRGYMGSAAEDYAKTNGNEFVAIDLEGIPDDLYIKWVWGDLNVPGTPTATVVLRSFEDETFIQELPADVTVERKDPTCEEAGYKEFTGSIMLYGIEYTDTATVKLKATGHDHYLTNTVWSEDHSSCTMAYSCHNCNMSPVIVEADVQHIVTPATCTERGSEEFYAEIQVDGKKLTASDGFALPAEGHDYQPEWSWSEDCSQCQAVLKCTKCGETAEPIAAHITHSDEESSPAACTESGLDVFIAEVTYEGMTYTEKKSVVLEALGHDHKVYRWQWSEDHSQCSAELKCTRCGHLADPIQAQVQRSEIPADCVNEGTITYTATITLNGEVLTDIQTEVIPAEGHSYQAQWEWAEDNSSCVAKLVCSKCGDTHSYTAAVTSSVALEPTYDDPGIREYTAVVQADGETYTDTVQSEIPALERTSIENARLNIGNTSFEYNGQEQTLTIASVKLNGVKLTEGVDYIVSGNKASESGDYSVVVTGIGAYKGTITRPWSIYKKYIVNCTVNDYTSCYIYTDKAHCTVTAEEVEGKFFSHWRLADDEDSFLSSRQSYTFRVVCDTDIEAVYVDSQEEVLDKPAIVITSVNAAQNRITYEVTRSVPDGYTVVSNGILYGTSKLLFADAAPETRDQLIRFTDDEGSTELKEKVHMSQSGVNTNQGYYAYTLNIGDHTDLKVYLRGYMILKDRDGQLVTYYTEIFDKTYDQVCQG